MDGRDERRRNRSTFDKAITGPLHVTNRNSQWRLFYSCIAQILSRSISKKIFEWRLRNWSGNPGSLLHSHHWLKWYPIGCVRSTELLLLSLRLRVRRNAGTQCRSATLPISTRSICSFQMLRFSSSFCKLHEVSRSLSSFPQLFPNQTTFTKVKGFTWINLDFSALVPLVSDLPSSYFIVDPTKSGSETFILRQNSRGTCGSTQSSSNESFP